MSKQVIISSHMLKYIFTIALLIAGFKGFSQRSENTIKILSRVKAVPNWYLKNYFLGGKRQKWKDVDSTYSAIVKMDTDAILNLIFILSDTTKTKISHPCHSGFLTYGQLAFLLINDIESVPYFLVTKSQWDVLGECGILPNGFLDYVKTNAHTFQNNYQVYFISKERQDVIKELHPVKIEQNRKSRERLSKDYINFFYEQLLRNHFSHR